MSDHTAVMYLGSIVEIADSAGLYQKARHPYTQALLSAIPDPLAREKGERIILKGEIPSPVNPPAGCRFHTRCGRVMDCCRQTRPRLAAVEGHDKVACFLYREGGRSV
jgi:peptide/nickel transport system ATP-binding protein/oligopeptide transport system ATP-binding protein